MCRPKMSKRHICIAGFNQFLSEDDFGTRFNAMTHYDVIFVYKYIICCILFWGRQTCDFKACVFFSKNPKTLCHLHVFCRKLSYCLTIHVVFDKMGNTNCSDPKETKHGGTFRVVDAKLTAGLATQFWVRQFYS